MGVFFQGVLCIIGGQKKISLIKMYKTLGYSLIKEYSLANYSLIKMLLQFPNKQLIL